MWPGYYKFIMDNGIQLCHRSSITLDHVAAVAVPHVEALQGHAQSLQDLTKARAPANDVAIGIYSIHINN